MQDSIFETNSLSLLARDASRYCAPTEVPERSNCLPRILNSSRLLSRPTKNRTTAPPKALVRRRRSSPCRTALPAEDTRSTCPFDEDPVARVFTFQASSFTLYIPPGSSHATPRRFPAFDGFWDTADSSPGRIWPWPSWPPCGKRPRPGGRRSGPEWHGP